MLANWVRFAGSNVCISGPNCTDRARYVRFWDREVCKVRCRRKWIWVRFSELVLVGVRRIGWLVIP